MIVARALGVTALDLFQPVRSSPDTSAAFATDGPSSAFDAEEAARLHLSGLLVRLLPVPSPPVRLGPALRAHPDRDRGPGLTPGRLA